MSHTEARSCHTAIHAHMYQQYGHRYNTGKVVSYTGVLDQLLDADGTRAKMVENVRRRLTLV